MQLHMKDNPDFISVWLLFVFFPYVITARPEGKKKNLQRTDYLTCISTSDL